MGCNYKRGSCDKEEGRPNKENGYQRNLYRNTDNGKIAGVCAGFADYFDIPVWVARLVFISLVIFTFQLALIAYVVAIFVIAKRTGYSTSRNDSDTRKKVFNYHQGVSSRLKEIRDRLRRLDKQVGSMEAYVTSKKYQTNNDINNL